MSELRALTAVGAFNSEGVITIDGGSRLEPQPTGNVADAYILPRSKVTTRSS
ncbi:hypothetical protein [Alicyclobacillus mengziensis]|uniref:Uncharacterized protein n=1 Tax=Alicyclobacillus mengziensis TaxID=2931921 RepID=A0A9X7Z6X1_9BACL|nr:hypothetical protein [Alicyclobacillus mengziensis]QSO46668.1 hypothetical protein JZ786_19830 [Alicyclobacillus mengziensis]